MERLAVLVPPPRCHMVRYHGILGPAAGRRDEVVPGPLVASRDQATSENHHAGTAGHIGGAQGGTEAAIPPAGRLPWAQLLARVFAVDVLVCARCGASTRIIAAIHSPQAIRAILDCLGLPTRPPPVAPPSLDRLLRTEA